MSEFVATTVSEQTSEGVTAEIALNIAMFYGDHEATDTSITDVAQLIADDAINQNIGLEELNGLLTSRDARSILSANIDHLIDVIFGEAVGSVMDDNTGDFTNVDALELSDAIHAYLPSLHRGNTVAEFLRNLIRSRCAQYDAQSLEAFRDYIKKYALESLVYGLLDAAKYQASRTYNEKLETRDANGKAVFYYQHVEALVDKARVETDDPATIAEKVAPNLIKARMSYAHVVNALCVTLKRFVPDLDIQPDVESFDEQKYKQARSNVEQGILRAMRTVNKEMYDCFSCEILDWYSCIGLDISIVEVVETIAQEAIENGDVSIDQIEGMLTSDEAQRALIFRLFELWEEVFFEFSDRQQESVQDFTQETAREFDEELGQVVPLLGSGLTTVAFLRGLIGNECFGKHKYLIEKVKEWMMTNGMRILFPGLMCAAKTTARKVFKEHLAKIASRPDILACYVSHLVAMALDDYGGVEAGLTKAVNNLLEVDVPHHDITRSLETGFNIAGHPEIASRVRARVTEIIDEITRADVATATSN